ncbi:MAG TPA: hypothetical protein PLE43_09620, partial [Alphaproteobacteria bacterium]|nr:hypothetical protein [Alphaproteobacteria bacterium]
NLNNWLINFLTDYLVQPLRFLSEAVRQHKELQPAWDAASSSLANKETPLVKTPDPAYPVPTV